MPGKYKRNFLIFLAITGVLVFIYVLLSQVKPPSMDKKNFFTLASKSPEYLLSPINIRDLTATQELPYPHVNVSPKSPLHQLIIFLQYWEISKKQYDDLFFANKRIAELINFGNEISWEKQLISYQDNMTKQIQADVSIGDPRAKMRRFIQLNTQVRSHQQKVYQLLANSTKSDEEKETNIALIDRVFTPLYEKLNPHLPQLRPGTIIYPLFDPLLDREYGTYEGQFIINDVATGDLHTVEVDNQNDFLFFPINNPVKPQKLSWRREKDPNNIHIYVATIDQPYTDKNTLAAIRYQTDKETKIMIQHLYKTSPTATFERETLLHEMVYPHTKQTTLHRVLNPPRTDVVESRFEIWVELLDQPRSNYDDTLPEVALTYYPAVDPAPSLLVTKKTVNAAIEPRISIQKLSPFRHKLLINNIDFFNGRQIRYNIANGWSVDDKNKVLFYYPGILVENLIKLSALLSIFYGLCLATKKHLDETVMKFLKKIGHMFKLILRSIFVLLKKVLFYTRFWSLLLGTGFMIAETFMHRESSDSLIFITVIFWLLATIGYSLESRFSFLVSVMFFVSSVFALIVKPNDNTNYNADKIAKYEIIANKFAVWTIVFFIVGFISTLLELARPETAARNLQYSINQLLGDWRSLLKRLNIIILPVRQLLRFYRPNTLSMKNLLISVSKISLTVLVIAALIIIRNQYVRHTQRENLNPVITKLEPKLVYQTTKFIIIGTGFGSFTENGTKLMSSYGELKPDTWTDSKVIYTVPFEWKAGKVQIWLEKPIEFEGKKMMQASEKIEIQVIPTGSTFGPLDDQFFEQLKDLDKETLEINGYK